MEGREGRLIFLTSGSIEVKSDEYLTSYQIKRIKCHTICKLAQQKAKYKNDPFSKIIENSRQNQTRKFFGVIDLLRKFTLYARTMKSEWKIVNIGRCEF